MDIEQLKLIIDAVAALGSQGREAFIWWLILDKVLPFILICTLLAMAYALLKRLIHLMAGQDEEALKTLRNILGVGCPGPVVDHEREQIIEKVRDLLRKKDV